MLLLNYHTKIQNKFTQDNKPRATWTENNLDEKPRALTTRTKNCPDNFFVKTKGHLPTSRILPNFGW